MAPASFIPISNTVCVMDAAGCLGASLVRRLLQRGYIVHATVQPNCEVQELKGLCNAEKERLKVFHSDLFYYQTILEALKGCSGLFYNFELPRDQPTYDEHTMEIEVRAAHNVLEACAQVDTIDKVVFTSSTTAVIWKEDRKAVSSNLDEKYWSDINFCRKFKLWHAVSKTLAEKTAWALAMDRGISMVTINAGLLLSPQLSISHPYLKGAAEMYQDGVLVTVDLNTLVDAHIYVFEDISSYGRYLCFNHVISRPEDATKFAKVLLPSASVQPQRKSEAGVIHFRATIAPSISVPPMSVNTPFIVQERPVFHVYSTLPVTLLITLLVLVMFAVGFFCVYLCRHCMNNLIYRRHSSEIPVNPTPTSRGLAHTIVCSFPLYSYARLNELCTKYALECAICLCEYIDSDSIRILPTCDHIFHQGCIDLWFESHTSCPVCRRLPQEGAQSPVKLPENVDAMPSIDTNIDHKEHCDGNTTNLRGDSIVIEIRDCAKEHVNDRPSTSATKGQVSPYIDEKFSRSHSTGHSIYKRNNLSQQGNDENYILTLPNHIRKSFSNKHVVVQSCTTFGDFASRNNKTRYVFGEISNSSTFRDTNKDVIKV